jgi:hypothetical protein
MVPHPSDVLALHGMNRRELIARAARERLADVACARPRRAGSRPVRLPSFAEVVPMLLAAVRPHSRPRFGSHAQGVSAT